MLVNEVGVHKHAKLYNDLYNIILCEKGALEHE